MSFRVTRLREGACFRCFDLAGVFAQLWRNPCQLELGVDFLFGFAGDVAGALQSGERVFVEGVAHVVGAAAEGDVVFFGAGEVNQGGAEVLFLEQPDVNLQAADQQKAYFVTAAG